MLFGAAGDELHPTAEVLAEEVCRKEVRMVVLRASTDEDLVTIRLGLDDFVLVTLWIDSHFDEHTTSHSRS